MSRDMVYYMQKLNVSWDTIDKRHRILELNTLTNQCSCDTHQIQLRLTINIFIVVIEPDHNRLEAGGQRVPAGLKNFLGAHRRS